MRSTLLAAVVALAAVAPVQAATLALPTDGSWAEFTVDAFLQPGHYEWVDADYAPLSFSFTVAAGQVGTLTVVDTGFSGDRFNIYNHGALLGSTGAAVQGSLEGEITLDPDAALANGDFSRGSFTLGAGNHLISGVLFGSATDTTIGNLKVTVSAVPEPTTYATLLIGLGLLVGALRRRQA